MLNRTIVLMLVALSGSPTGAVAEMTGHDLHELCTLPGGPAKLTCGFYITGLHEGVELGATINGPGAEEQDEGMTAKRNRSWGACIPPETPEYELIYLLMDYLEANPQERDQPAGEIFLKASQQAFPCE